MEISPGTGPDGRDQVSYTNPVGVTGFDWFHYVVEDVSGKFATGLVAITLQTTTPTLWSAETDGDSYVQGTTGDNFGGEETIELRRSTAGPSPWWTATGWFHFDLSGVDTSSGTPELVFTFDSMDSASGTATVWGITDGSLGDNYGTDWHEDSITGSNTPHPADLSESSALDIVGTFDVVWAETYKVSSPELTALINTDTNDEITIIITRSPQDKLFYLRSRENPSGGAAMLRGKQ